MFVENPESEFPYFLHFAPKQSPYPPPFRYLMFLVRNFVLAKSLKNCILVDFVFKRKHADLRRFFFFLQKRVNPKMSWNILLHKFFKVGGKMKRKAERAESMSMMFTRYRILINDFSHFTCLFWKSVFITSLSMAYLLNTEKVLTLPQLFRRRYLLKCNAMLQFENSF